MGEKVSATETSPHLYTPRQAVEEIVAYWLDELGYEWVKPMAGNRIDQVSDLDLEIGVAHMKVVLNCTS